MQSSVQLQLHGYRSGHQLLQSSVRLNTRDQDAIDHLSDIAGPLRPGERFAAYFTAYPIPSLEYYALARTEQDSDAPRAGCVITKTLLVPMDFWANEASPAMLAVLLANPVNEGQVMDSVSLAGSTLPQVHDSATMELVEALFLEKRRAIVIFGAQDAEEEALRLLTVFWPHLRRTFSLCTFALAPRTLSGRPFDLLFAPKSVRSRFSDWEGRRIEAGGDGTARHRWTPILVERIFRSPTPYLANADSVNLLTADDRNIGESTLRLSLLWDELLEKTNKSPTAALGLIDIANSLCARASAWNVLEPVVAGAVVAAAQSFDVSEAWRFITTLLGKLSSRQSLLKINEAIRSAGIRLAQKNWRAAVTYLSDAAAFESPDNMELLRAVAREVARADTGVLSQALVRLSPDRLLKVAFLDEKMLARLMVATDPAVDSAMIQRLTEGWRLLTFDERSRYRFDIIRHIRSDKDCELLAQVVQDIKIPDLLETVNLIWGQVSCRTVRIGEVLCRAAETSDARREVRIALARLSGDALTNQCIKCLLIHEPVDVMWLLESTAIKGRRALFLNFLIKGASGDDLRRALPSDKMVAKVVQILVADLERYAFSISRVVMLPYVSATDHLAFGLKVYPKLQRAQRIALGQSLVTRVFTDEIGKSEDIPEAVIDTVIGDLEISSIIITGLDPKRDVKQISRALVAFESVGSAARFQFGKHVALIVRCIVRRGDFDLTAEATTVLARFIDAAADSDHETYVEICSIVLPYAMATSRRPASQIVMVAFPTVYEELRQGRGNIKIGNLFDFLDWDKCKIARKELVRAFMRSEWPPGDLAMAALRACELHKILKRVARDPGGERYLRKIEKEARYLDGPSRKAIVRTIKEIQEAPFGSLEGRSYL